MPTLNAAPAKLANGSWGARVDGVAKPGDAITITTAAGKSWRSRVVQVVWTGGGVTLVATASSAPPSKTGKRRRPRSERGYTMIECGDCQRLGTMCQQCRFDEYD